MTNKGGAMRSMMTLAVLVVLAGCATVDETEWCAKTRYGRVVEENVGTGLHWSIFTDYTCFDMTDRTYPEDETVETMDAQTSDQLTVQGDVSVVVVLNPETMSGTFRDKRRPNAVDGEVRNAIRSGYRNAIAGWAVGDIFSPRRASLADSVRNQIQASLGGLANVLRVYVRDIKVPPAVEQARIQAAAQEQNYIAALRQAQIDSVAAWGEIQKLAAQAEGERLQASAFNDSPALLQLRSAEALSEGLARACQGVTTCILGGDVMDRFLSAATGVR